MIFTCIAPPIPSPMFIKGNQISHKERTKIGYEGSKEEEDSPKDEKVSKISRTQMTFYVVAIDIMTMSTFFLAFLVIEYLITRDTERQKSILIETSEFAICLENIPH